MDANDVRIEISHTKKEKPAADRLVFGRAFTDHMFIADYREGTGWRDHRIVPYQPICLDPSANVFHYGQTVFEGMKAYLAADGSVRLFRPLENMKRMNASCERLSMPQIDEEEMLRGLIELIKVDKEWIPSLSGTSLYIRPFMIGTEPFLGVAPSTLFQFIVILSPVGSYYPEGVHPVRILVENEYVRAVRGGTGAAKTAGNYASGLKGQDKASSKGFSQVLWLDGIERRYVEEVGSMNVFFKIAGEVVTPALSGSILPGITRKSILELLAHKRIPVTERRISIEEIYEAHANGALEEAFGTGTAAVISPMGELNWNGRSIAINGGKTGPLSKELYDELTGIQSGALDDPFGWVTVIE